MAVLPVAAAPAFLVVADWEVEDVGVVVLEYLVDGELEAVLG